MTTEQKFDCVFCKEVFDEKEALQIHFRKHGDPNFNFNQSIKNKSKPQNDISNEKITDENETVGCDVCDEVFPTISKAITHKHKAHPDHDAKYFCPFCGKLFTMKHLYNKHIQSNHEEDQVSDTKDFHCDCCEVDFCVPSAMIYHNKFFHRQDTELPTIGQSKKVKTYNQEMIQIYYCSFCGEEYNNKVNLHKHMTDDHSDENQSPSDILRCPLCEAIFYHLDAYEVHLMFHSTDDLYSEKNEIAEHVTDFSLEAVAPIMEKVEEDVPNLNNDGIDSFLQLVMNDTGDNEPDKVKPKKHKKHKKSKKAAITLDEFLNMNKDVFGDGLDVQGIEEVPTQVVLKKVKGKKLPTKGQTKAVNADLAKLKKHGITITSKLGSQLKQINKNDAQNIKVNKMNVTSNHNELLSKLLNQGNSEIKIVKKSMFQKLDTDNDTLGNSKNDNIDNSNENNNGDQDLRQNKVADTDDNSVDGKVCKTISEFTDNTQNNVEFNSTNSNANLQHSNTEEITANDTRKLNNVTSDLIKSTIPSTNKKLLSLSEGNQVKTSNKLPDSIVSGFTGKEIKQVLPADNPILDTPEISLQKDMDVDSETENNQEKEADDNLAHDTLNALKHLSHLITVKPVNQPKSPKIKTNNDKTVNEDEYLDRAEESVFNKSAVSHFPSEQKVNNAILIKNQTTVTPSKKSPSEHTQSDFDSDEFNDFDETNSDTEFDKLEELEVPNRNIRRVKLKIRNLPASQSRPANIEINKMKHNEAENDEELQNEDNCNNTPTTPTNMDILKRLTNVTAKTIASVKNTSQQSDIKIFNQPRKMFPRNITKNPSEVEIFNIDDSDSDGEQLEDKQPNHNLDALRNLNKNITIKSNQQNVDMNEVKDKKSINTNTRSEVINEKHIKLGKHSPDVQKSINLQNKLKNLGGNITVTSNNFSNMTDNEHSSNFEEFDEDEANDSESENYGSKLKITELNENDVSDSECHDSRTDAIVESPHASNSDNEDNHMESDEEFADFEKQIKSAMVKKREEPTTSKTSACIENFKNLNKNLTIKSLNARKPDLEDETSFSSEKEAFEDSNSQQIPVKQLKPINKPNQSSTSLNQTHQKNVSTSSNQVVKTVKKFQSQTVIEEVTTTVTKTIRTVNQSTNEMVQNNNIRPQRPMMRPQKIINRAQATVVRPSPAVGTKIRNAAPIRHPTPSTVKPSNQLVPVRGVINLQRSSTPSTSAVRKLAPPKSSLQNNNKNHMIGKLKISPHALNQATKRIASEAVGHFNCFKRPKESSTTLMDTGDSLDDTTMQYTSASQSQSNFSSVTKTIKGKGVVTATQMREMSTSSQQQLSKINNISGLMVAKTSSKQAVHMEEKNIISTAKRNTLDALEKLQKQGLLVKKPRVDDYHEKSQSESDDDPS